MGYKSDIEIAQEATPQPIGQIASSIGLTEDQFDYYGKYKAKVDYSADHVYKEEAYQAYLGLTHCF